jgi:hypothetical protein
MPISSASIDRVLAWYRRIDSSERIAGSFLSLRLFGERPTRRPPCACSGFVQTRSWVSRKLGSVSGVLAIVIRFCRHLPGHVLGLVLSPQQPRPLRRTWSAAQKRDFESEKSLSLSSSGSIFEEEKAEWRAREDSSTQKWYDISLKT